MRDTVVVLLFWGVGYIPRYSPTPLHSIVNGGQSKQGLLQLRGGDAAGAEVQPGLRSLPSSVPPATLMTKKRRGVDVAELARHVEGIGADCSHPPAKARRAGRPPGKVKNTGSEKGVTAKKKRIKKVEEKGILCYRCRRSRSTLRQHSIMSFCSPIKENPTGHTTALDCDDAAKCCDVAKCEDAANDWDDAANTVDVNSLQHHHHNNTHFDIQQAPTYFHLNISTTAEGANGKAPGSLADDTVETVEQCSMLVCRQCRRPMEESAPVSSANSRIAITRICPSIVKVRGYKRIAAEKKIAWRILESDAQRVMLRPCYFCGRRAAENPGGFNGINRVNHTLQYYDHDNIAAACKDCNTMKHDHSSQDFVNICRHVASFNELGDFGLFPLTFRNASSRRGRSAYLTKSKTHALSKEEYEHIIAQPCYYCGKATVADEHYNGLDRIDSTVRVYTSRSCVAACGTCNTMKWRRTPSAFTTQCAAVASFAMQPHELPNHTATTSGLLYSGGGGRECPFIRQQTSVNMSLGGGAECEIKV